MSVLDDYLNSIPDDKRREDCRTLAHLMSRIGGEPWLMGSSILGFGSYHYRYESGREGDSCLIGFASRKNEIVIYAHAGGEELAPLVARLGKQKAGKGCLYVKKVADIDLQVLEEILSTTVATLKARYPAA